MLKVRMNLRKVATIVACLAVTTIFATCGNNGGDDDDGNGKGRELTAEEKKFLGTWNGTYFGISGSANLRAEQFIQFKSDGTYLRRIYTYVSGSTQHHTQFGYKGNWRVSGGKIYFTNVTVTTWTGYKDVPNGTTFKWQKSEDENLKIESHGIDEYGQEYIRIADKDVQEGDYYTKEASIPDWVFGGWS